MSFPLGVAAVTPIAGSKTGTFVSDLITLGQWPQEIGIGKITAVSVWAGDIIDSQTVQHGGNGGKQVLSFTLAANQKIVAVYGRHLREGEGPYGPNNLVQLSFVVATSGADGVQPATSQVFTATAGFVTKPNIEFDFEWSLEGAVAYSFQPAGLPNSYLQGLGFTEVFSPVPGTV